MRVEKKQMAQYVSSIVQDSSFLFFVTYKGLNVLQFSDFRDKLFDVGAQCHVLKNTLIKFGLDSSDLEIPEEFRLTGDTSVVFGSGDPCPSAKVIKNFSKDAEAVSFKAGLVDGTLLHSDEAAMLADLPSKEALQSQLLGVLTAPMSNLVGVFNAKTTSLLYLLKDYINKKEQSS